MIDDGELDWKIIAINADDPKAASLNDIEDVERCATYVVICAKALGTLSAKCISSKLKVWQAIYQTSCL